MIMLTKRDTKKRSQMEFTSLEHLVPQDHILRKIDQAMDFSFIYDEVKSLYSSSGRPSIDPVVLVKIILIQHLFGIPSMRQTIKEIEVNLAYRWFLGYGMLEKIPHFSTFNKNYERRFKHSNLFQAIFVKVLEQAEHHKLINPEQIYIDSTHIKASANKKKYKKVVKAVPAKVYQEELDAAIGADRKLHDKKPLKKKDNSQTETKAIIQSTTDAESGMFYKNEKEKCFAYLAHTACDDGNFILGFEVTAGNIHDSVAFKDVYDKVKKRYGQKVERLAVDAGYITPHICKTLIDDGIDPAIPYKAPMTKEGFFKKYEYTYDEHYDCYICPENQILTYSTTNRDGYKEYKSNPKICKDCKSLKKCTNSKNTQKLVTRHVWAEYLEEAHHLRYKPLVKGTYKRRKETIERVFADAKEKHGMRYTRLRSVAKITMEVTLIFACMNLKKLASRLWKRSSASYYRKITVCNIWINIEIMLHTKQKRLIGNFQSTVLSTI